MERIQVYHFNNGTGGGVLSVIRSLVKFSADARLEHHVIYTINKFSQQDYEIPALEGAASQQVFYYSPKWNFYYTCRQLAKLLPDKKTLIVTHDWLELGMVSQLALQNPVVQVVHGNYEYYYSLACKHQDSINKYVAISPVIANKLRQLLPLRTNDIKFLKYPVPSIQSVKEPNQYIRLFYCVRRLDDPNKQFKVLPLINQQLIKEGVHAEWTIVGAGFSLEQVQGLMGQQQGIFVYQQLSNSEVLGMLPKQDIFLLPSLQEGFPVAVVEAMKAGVVPLISDWEGATADLVIPGETGYYVETSDIINYTSLIKKLNTDRALLARLSVQAQKKANELFDPITNTRYFDQLFVEAGTAQLTNRTPTRLYGSRLDKRWIPNILVKTIRQFFI